MNFNKNTVIRPRNNAKVVDNSLEKKESPVKKIDSINQINNIKESEKIDEGGNVKLFIK